MFVQLNVRIDPNLDARLRRFCLEAGVKRTKAVIEALDRYFEIEAVVSGLRNQLLWMYSQQPFCGLETLWPEVKTRSDR